MGGSRLGHAVGADDDHRRRRGEVSALRWRHLDFDRGQLTIANNHVVVRGGVIEKLTKSGSQPRVALDPCALDLLAEHRERVAAGCDVLGIELTDDAYVLSLQAEFDQPALPLRHYSATELIAAGIDVRTVAGRLGHGGGGSTTLPGYADWVNRAIAALRREGLVDVSRGRRAAVRGQLHSAERTA